MTDANSRHKFINERYLIRHTLGQGGMGQVLLVEDSWQNYRPVALKKMRQDKLQKNEVSSLRREFLAVAHLSHPNLAEAIDFGSDWHNGDVFFTSEFIDGVHLDTGLKEKNLDTLLEAFIQTCRGLEFIHNHGFIHGDIKPENILLQADKVAVHDGDDDTKDLAPSFLIKLIDFGLTVRERGFVGKKIVGTAYYVAPEVILGAMSDRRTDLYSLGVVFYMLTTGKLPFTGKRNIDILKGHLQHAPPPPHEVRPDIPLGLSHLIMRLMAKKPNQRPASAATIIAMLSDISGRHFPMETPKTKTSYISSAPFIGRTEELAILQSRILATLQLAQPAEASEQMLAKLNKEAKALKPCRLILIEGEKGTGKKRMLQELKNFAQTGGAMVITTQGDNLLDDMARKLQTEPKNAQVLDRLLKLPHKQPVLLLVQDGESCSGHAAAFLSKLVRACRKSEKPMRLLPIIIATQNARSQALSEFLLFDFVQQGLFTLPLREFDEHDIRQLLEQTFPDNKFSPSLTDQLMAESEGSPQSIFDILHTLLLNDHIIRKKKHWTAAFSTLSDLPLPRTGRMNFEQKISRLHEDSRHMARTLSVLDGTFSMHLIGRLASLSMDKLLPALTELKNHGILLPVKDEFTFCSRSIRELLHNQLDAQTRKAIHHKVAKLLETHKAPPESLFRHYYLSGDGDNICRYGIEAVQSLYRQCEYEKALGILLQLKAIPEWPGEMQYELLRSELLCLLAQNRDAEHLLISLFDKAELGDQDKPTLLLRLAALKIKLARPEEAGKLIQQGMQLAKKMNNMAIIGSFLLIAAELYSAKGQFLESSHTLKQALKALKRVKDKDRQWQAQLLQSENFFQLGKTEEALLTLGEALEILDTYPDVRHMMASLKGLAMFWKYRNYPGKSIMQLKVCLAICERLNMADAEAECLAELSGLHIKRGEIAKARQHLRRALKILEETENQHLQMKVQLLLAVSAWQVGYFEETKAQCKKALKLSRIFHNEYAGIRTKTILASLYIDQGRMTKADKILLDALKYSGHAESIRAIRQVRAFMAAKRGHWQSVYSLLKKSFSSGKMFHPVYTLLFAIACFMRNKPESLISLRKGLNETGTCEDIAIIKAISLFINGMIRLGGRYANAGLPHFRDALQQARTSKSDRLIIWICLFYGRTLIRERQFEQAFLALEEGLFLAKRLNLIALKGYLWLELGQLEIRMPGGKLDRSMHYLESAETVGTKYHLDEVLALALVNKGIILSQNGQFKKASLSLVDGTSMLKDLANQGEDNGNKASSPPNYLLAQKLEAAEKELEKINKLDKVDKGRNRKKSTQGFFGLLGNSDAAQKIFRAITALTPAARLIWVTGPAGAGKTAVAQAIHGSLKGDPDRIRHQNCMDLTDDALTSLAATLASESIQTLVLEEASNLSTDMQKKLRKAMPKSLLRIIATSSYDLEELFETEVLSRAHMAHDAPHIAIPPLTERQKDMEVLLHHYLRECRPADDTEPLSVDGEAKTFLLNYPWPRNITELAEFCSRAYTFAGGSRTITQGLAQTLLRPTKSIHHKT